ncbi:MAG: glycosyltransferase family 2 protein [Bacteroidaceae bacterium]
MPIVSFIITYYNEPLPLLADCLRSVLHVRACMMERGMHRDDFEIILVDDGSQASPQEMLGQMDAGIRYVCQKNAGLSAARNAGLELARGEYVQFVDADDALLPQTYCSICPRSREESDIILFNFTRQEASWHEAQLCMENGSSTPRLNTFQDGSQHQQVVSGVWYMQHHNLKASACCYLFRKSLIGNLRFAEGLLHEDELFTPLLFLRMHTVCRHEVPAYYYRQRIHTITHSSTSEQVNRRLDSVETVLHRLLDVCATLLSEDRHALMRRVEQLAADYIYNVYRLEVDPDGRSRRLRVLEQMHLLPLPLHFHTLRHGLFSLMTHFPRGFMDALMRLLVSKSENV